MRTYRIQIDFISIRVHDDADNWPNGEGEIFFDLRVNNQIVRAQGPNQAIGADSGDTIALNATHEITLSARETLTVTGTIQEDDDFLSGAVDTAGTFWHTYGEANGWGAGDRSVRLTNDGLDVELFYKVTVLEMHQQPLVSGNGTPINLRRESIGRWIRLFPIEE